MHDPLLGRGGWILWQSSQINFMGQRSWAIHLIKAETYENYGSLLVNLYRMLNFQPWPIYILISHAAFCSLFFSISTSGADKGKRGWGLPLVRTFAKCTTHILKSHWRGTERKRQVCVGGDGHPRQKRRHFGELLKVWNLRWSRLWNKTSESSSWSLRNVVRH